MAELKYGRVAGHMNRLTEKLKKQVEEISTDDAILSSASRFPD